MRGTAHRHPGGALLIAAGLVLALCGGCLSITLGPPVFRYFAEPDADDPWSRKIAQWQQRERDPAAEAPLHTPAAVAVSGAEAAFGAREELRTKFDEFLSERRRAQAREIASWIQDVAQQHYIADGPIDRWATLRETFDQNGDDCDGLELLTYNALLSLGFGEGEVFRAIVYRRSDGQHHMVTFWFETPDDPWVIDPTGAMTSGMPRMSEVPGWEPLKVFNEERDFDAVRQAPELHANTR